MSADTATQADEIYRFLCQCGAVGATDEEISVTLKVPGNSARPARIDLLHTGRVKDSGTRRFTQAGKQAVVWVVTA